MLLVAGSALALVASASAEPGLRVSTAFLKSYLHFGDTTTARVVVTTNRRRIDPRSVRVSPDFGVWEPASGMQTSVSSDKDLVRQSWTFRILCVDPSCLPDVGRIATRLPPVAVSVQTTAGVTKVVKTNWPVLSIDARFGASARGATPTFDLDQTPPRPSYGVSPTVLVAGLACIAAALVALGLLAIARVFRPRRNRPSHKPTAAPSVREALSVVRGAKGKPVADRRLAVGRLARVLDESDTGALSTTASRVAWSSDEPSAERLDALVRLVEDNYDSRT